MGNRDLDWQNRVAPETKRYVLSLPRIAQCDALLLTHGDPKLTPALSTGQIGKQFVRVWLELAQRNAQVWAFGHSHYARLWHKRVDQPSAELVTHDRVEILDGHVYCLNVGTTGLPFPGKGGPSVALVDFERREIRQIPLESG